MAECVVPRGGGRRILVVDDSAAQRRLIRISLEKWGYLVAEASSGAEGLDLCRREGFDLVISDWVMPGLTGPEFCRAWRSLPGAHFGYFILVTSKSGKEEVAAGLEAGADDFLTKPVSAAELRARLRAGERQLDLRAELQSKNDQLAEALSEVRRLWSTLEHDLAEARRLQQLLVRGRHLDLGRATVSFSLHPSGHVGGDLVGYIPRGSGRVAIFSIDVSGHGVAAAMLAARLSGIFASAFKEGDVLYTENRREIGLPGPRQITERLNQLLQVMGLDHYFTWACAEMDLRNGRVALVQAGHPHPLLLRTDGAVEMAGPGGLPVGLIANASWEEAELHLQPGERLMLMTDGLTECRNPSGQELGDEGLMDLVRRNSSLRGEAFLLAIEQALIAFNGGPDFADDLSFAVIEWRG
ncbi:fused response regulator/phosphatase [Falsigemmobacter faecalis]|uniref:Fused response regulator/phosphatase n=2 Tax=Falsigemmobacter faecalis TaxID=2488730 RepID=A0A3P3DV87_9RHOB|nr:fused response regulator/phosphatase [Falsigemmobacter faecalis]